MKMKKLMVVLSALCLVLGAGVAQADTIEIRQANIAENRTLMDGNTYRFAKDVYFKAAAGESALTVAEGATVTLEILAGAEVTFLGGDADGTTGAGAGIAAGRFASAPNAVRSGGFSPTIRT